MDEIEFVDDPEDEIEFINDPEDFGKDTELVPLTDELKAVFGERKFQTEETLHHFMDQAGIANFRVIVLETYKRSFEWFQKMFSVGK